MGAGLTLKTEVGRKVSLPVLQGHWCLLGVREVIAASEGRDQDRKRSVCP